MNALEAALKTNARAQEKASPEALEILIVIYDKINAAIEKRHGVDFNSRIIIHQLTFESDKPDIPYRKMEPYREEAYQILRDQGYKIGVMENFQSALDKTAKFGLAWWIKW